MAELLLSEQLKKFTEFTEKDYENAIKILNEKRKNLEIEIKKKEQEQEQEKKNQRKEKKSGNKKELKLRKKSSKPNSIINRVATFETNSTWISKLSEQQRENVIFFVGTNSFSMKKKKTNYKFGFIFAYLKDVGFIRFGISIRMLLDLISSFLPEKKISIFKKFKEYKTLLNEKKYINNIFFKGTLKMIELKDSNKFWARKNDSEYQYRVISANTIDDSPVHQNQNGWLNQVFGIEAVDTVKIDSNERTIEFVEELLKQGTLDNLE